MFDGGGNIQPNVTDWDTYCRQQAFWETPQQLNANGIACKELTSLSTDFLVKGAIGQVLEMTCTARGYQTQDKNADVFFDATASSENLVVINNRLSNKTYSSGWYVWTHTFQWLINRPDIGRTTFTFSLNGGGFSMTSAGAHHSLTHWEVIDSGRAALNNQMKMAAQVEELRAQVDALRGVDPTTDIDPLRSS